MRLEIDNFDGAGVCDYTAWMDAERKPRVVRRLNRAAEMWCGLVRAGLAVLGAGARVCLRKDSGEAVFTGYLDAAAEREHCGWGQAGPVYRYAIHAIGDEWALDRGVLPQRPVFVMRTAGEIVREITAGLPIFAEGGQMWGTDQVQDGGVVAQFGTSLKRWSECVAQVARQTRSAYRAHDGDFVVPGWGAGVHDQRGGRDVFAGADEVARA